MLSGTVLLTRSVPLCRCDGEAIAQRCRELDSIRCPAPPPITSHVLAIDVLGQEELAHLVVEDWPVVGDAARVDDDGDNVVRSAAALQGA